jgi:phosphatidylserine/phosphatidylglycerophosphate/cardiolipin synthase-like enzyme
MARIDPSVLGEARIVARELSAPALDHVIGALESAPPGLDERALRARVCSGLGTPEFRHAVGRLLDRWLEVSPGATGAAVAAAVAAASYSDDAARYEVALELIWTGPSPRGSSLRRTDQALLQLIDEARRNLTIVSFAVYRVPDVGGALVRALERGVALRFIAETPEADDAPFGVLATFGEAITRRARIYAWPRDRRPKDANGRPSLLHVKCAVADSRLVFLSSANLTEHAMMRNMEMGLLMTSADLGAQIVRHFDSLVEDGTLVLSGSGE